jgi:hypothetical protein
MPEWPGKILANTVVAPHFGQGGCEIWNMSLALKRAGARHSQSPVFAEKGAVMQRACAPGPGSCWSILLIHENFTNGEFACARCPPASGGTGPPKTSKTHRWCGATRAAISGVPSPFARCGRHPKLGGSDVCPSLIERIPEHDDHHLLRSRVRDLCTRHVSVSQESDVGALLHQRSGGLGGGSPYSSARLAARSR